MQKPSIELAVMARLFPLKKDTDPVDWQTHVRRNLVHEVRAETVCFYGPTDCLEAQYPGLDYNKAAHRMRLSRFVCHRRLFRAFDELCLTDNEIQKLCQWEGTRWAKEKYEANNGGEPIKDTTWDGIPVSRQGPAFSYRYPSQTTQMQEIEAGETGNKEMEDEHNVEEGGGQLGNARVGESSDEEGSEDESEDGIHQSVGVELNQRLIAATEARARGEDATLDPDWEQWLKEAMERGVVPNTPQNFTPFLQDAPQNPVYWGREIPAYLSDNPTPEMAAIQARLPPPPQYYQHFSRPYATSPLAAPASFPPPPRGGTTL